METRVGFGYDIHRLAEGRKLLLGGVEIPASRGLLGHSDGDVLLHALIDAILGAAAFGDIGEHFPDTDPQYAQADSVLLARRILGTVFDAGWRVGNADLTVIAEAPRLSAFKERIRRRIAELLRVGTDRVNVKAKTKEGLGAVGEGLAMEAYAVVTLTREAR